MPSYTEILFVTVIMNMGGCCCCSHLKMIHFTWQLQSTIQRNRTGEPAAVHSTAPDTAPFFWVQSQNTGETLLTSRPWMGWLRPAARPRQVTTGHDGAARWIAVTAGH